MESTAGQDPVQAIGEMLAEIRTELAEFRNAVQKLDARMASVEKQLKLVWKFLFLMLGMLIALLLQ